MEAAISTQLLLAAAEDPSARCIRKHSVTVGLRREQQISGRGVKRRVHVRSVRTHLGPLPSNLPLNLPPRENWSRQVARVSCKNRTKLCLGTLMVQHGFSTNTEDRDSSNTYMALWNKMFSLFCGGGGWGELDSTYLQQRVCENSNAGQEGLTPDGEQRQLYSL